jgi:trigger factor
LDIQIQKKNSLEGTIVIQIQPTDYASLVADKLREYTKKARVKGFRVGHAPLFLIKKMYGPGIMFETVTTLASDSLSTYLKESDLHIVGQPLPKTEMMQDIDWENQQEFNFHYDVGWVPAFQTDIGKDLKVTAYQVNQMSAAYIDEVIENLRKKQGERQTVEISEIGDVIIGSLTHQELDEPEIIYLPVLETKGKASENLIGLQVGDQIEVDLKELIEQGIEPAEIDDQILEELMALNPPFEFRVEEIERYIAAELDQTFFDQVLGPNVADSLDDFRVKLQERILYNKQRKAELLLDKDIQEALLEAIRIDLPDDFLKRWLQQGKNKVASQDLEWYYEHYSQGLRWELITQKIIEENGLSVNDDAVMEATKNRLKAVYQISDDILDQVVQTFLQEKQGDNYINIHKEVVLDKVFGLIKEKITLVYQDISAEELDQLE